MSEFVRRIEGVNYIDAERLWASIEGVPLADRLRQLMINAGVAFFDEGKRAVKEPIVGISGLGGFPIHFDETTPEGKIRVGIAEGTPEQHFNELKKTRGFAGFITTANSGDKSPEAMDDMTTRLGHASKLRTTMLDTMFIGYSGGIEPNFGRLYKYATHLGVTTFARIAAQSAPPIAVQDPAYVDVALAAYEALKGIITGQVLPKDRAERLDALEDINGLLPKNAALACMVDADLNTWRMMMSILSDKGQERAWHGVMALLNDQLFALFPEHFKHSSAHGYEMPAHLPSHAEWSAKRGAVPTVIDTSRTQMNEGPARGTNAEKQ
ncbi:MAG: hypothetical protein SFW64_02300 [Alphaproteobacteria bacterium]|nr:hypothetical protein [Alphaproteobacteria bacterium]